MLKALRDILEPRSLLELVPEEVLRALMQGFFYGQRAGVVLIYNECDTATDLRTLERLHPVDRLADRTKEFELFNPFCALFRCNPSRNAQCEACDERRARTELAGATVQRRYTCHMGLIDMTIPVRVNGRVRGVLFGGQKILREEQTLQLIRRRVAEKASDISAELIDRMEAAAIGTAELDEFEAQFVAFAKAFQAAVDAFALVRRHETERATLLTVSEQMSKLTTDDTVGVDDATRPLLQDADPLFRELETLVGGRPVWLLQRRGSRYVCVAASPSGSKGLTVSVPAWMLIETHLEVAERLHTNQPAAELKARLTSPGDDVTVIRSETQIGQSEWVSVALVVGGTVPPQYCEFMIGCARALTYPTGVSWLLRRLHRQQADFERSASFIGHHMKTPLQVAMLAIGEAVQLPGDTDEEKIERTKLLNEAEVQISYAVADAMRLQGAAIAPKRERYDVRAMLEKLADDMRPLARSRAIVDLPP